MNSILRIFIRYVKLKLVNTKTMIHSIGLLGAVAVTTTYLDNAKTSYTAIAH
jgi:hypothetical protein